MRNKKAKALRAMAQSATVGKEDVIYKKTLSGQVILGDCTRKNFKEIKKCYSLSVAKNQCLTSLYDAFGAAKKIQAAA